MPLLRAPMALSTHPCHHLSHPTVWLDYPCLLKQIILETEAAVLLIVVLPTHSKYSENVKWVNESIKYETSFVLKPVLRYTVELGRTITFCTRLHCPVFVFILLIFWSGFQCQQSPINDKSYKTGGDTRYHVLYKSLCKIKFPMTCSPPWDCGRGWVSQQIRRQRGHWTLSQ